MTDPTDDGPVEPEYDPETDRYYAAFEFGRVRPSTAVALSVARLSGRDVEALTPLQELIDPDALDDLFHSLDDAAPDDVSVAFGYHGYEVTVRGSGVVALRGAD